MRWIALTLLAALVISSAAAATDDKDAPGKISGFPIQRSGGGWLGLEIDDGHFVMTFYSAKKKPVPADVSGAVLRWPVHYQPNDERTELVGGGDPSVLASAMIVKPPYSFKLRITLITGPKPDDVEVYSVDFSQ